MNDLSRPAFSMQHKLHKFPAMYAFRFFLTVTEEGGKYDTFKNKSDSYRPITPPNP